MTGSSFPTGVAAGAVDPTGKMVELQVDGSGNLKTVGSGGSGGTVTANAGTNLNTSALALETGGNLTALVAAATSAIPAGTNLIGKTGIDQTTPGTTNAVVVTGTVPLPAGAATSANQPSNAAQGAAIAGLTANLFQSQTTSSRNTFTTATANPLQSDLYGQLLVARGSFASTVSPTVTAAAYTAGNCLGGLMTFTRTGDTGILQSLTVTCKSVQTTGIKAYIFHTNPSSTTFTDKTAPSINVADFNKVIWSGTLSAADSGLGTQTMWQATSINVNLTAATWYVLLTVVATPTLASTSDISCRVTGMY